MVKPVLNSNDIRDSMHRFAFVFGSLALAASQLHAELIINGQPVTTTAPVPSTIQPQNNFQVCLANLRGQGRRSVLALLGVVIGSAAIVALMNIAHIAQL